MRQRFIWICVVAMCLGAFGVGWFLGGLEMRYDAATSGTATEDSFYIRDWTDDLGETDGRMWLPDGFGGHREPLGEIDRLTVRVDSLGDVLRVGGSAAPVLAFADALPETMKPWADTDTKWVADHDGNRWVQEGTGRQCTLIDTLHWRGFDRLIPPWRDEITVSDTTWFAEADGKRDIVLHVDGAEIEPPICFESTSGGAILEPTRISVVLYGRLHWAKGEWVFKGTP